LTLTRPRQGIPSRASEAERIEYTTGTITLEEGTLCFGIGPDIAASSLTWPIIRRVAVFAESDDPVSLTSDDVRVTVPASVTPVDGLALVEVTILAPVSGVTLEATQGTATADCSVTATEAAPVPVPEIEPNDTMNLFPRWLHSEPHAIGLSAVLDFARAAWTDTMLPSLLIYDVDNQTSEILDLVAEAFSIYGWNKAAGEAEKIAFLRNSLKIQRKIGTGYAVKQAIRLVCDDAKINDIIITEGAGGWNYDGTVLYDGSHNYDSRYHWARFTVTIQTSHVAYFIDEIKASIVAMINHYKPVSRWLEELIIDNPA
jgi:P2-related tail formation protein